MTNFIKKLMAAVTLLGVVSVTPVLADECKIGTRLQVQEQMADVEGLTARDLTPAEAQKLIDSKGPPPNAEGTEGLSFELVTKGDIAAINVYQNDCFINRLGPTLKQNIYNMLGLNEAGLPVLPEGWDYV